jgi:hypothetical protein
LPLLIVSVVPASPTAASPQPVATACAAPISQATHARHARWVYHREHVTKANRRELTEMRRCALSSEAASNMRRVEHREARKRKERAACSQTKVTGCIKAASRRYGVSFSMLLRKARCESRLDPRASNGAHTGLFQFRTAAPSTWATTPYAGRSPWSAKWNSLAAAWMHATGRGGEWACK